MLFFFCHYLEIRFTERCFEVVVLVYISPFYKGAELWKLSDHTQASVPTTTTTTHQVVVAPQLPDTGPHSTYQRPCLGVTSKSD